MRIVALDSQAMSGQPVEVQLQTFTDVMRVRFDTFELDEANASLLREGKPVPLAPTPFAVLCALVRQPGSLLTKNALLDEVWGHRFVSESVLKTTISEIRTALRDDARQPRFIETVSRRGYRFIATTVAISAAPSPLAGVSPTAPSRPASFVGREEALARLRSAWDSARGGKRSVVWVAGEPGIGKTTLIEHFVAGLGDVACARGQCVDHYGTGEPYLPVLEALAELSRSDSALAPLLRAVAPIWLLQLPWLSTVEERDALRRELAGVSPERMLREMGELLDRYTERRPLLLVTEDLHWSDRATIQLIDAIARRRGGGRLLWLASFRLAEVVALDHPLNPMRHELRLHGLCEEIVLDPFSEREVADYVAARSPVLASDEAFVRTLHERTDGVPLFLASVMREVTTGVAPGGDDAAVEARLAKVAVPENLAAIIDHYIAKLGNEQRGLLSAAAVCGVEFRVTTLSAALARDAAWVEQTCEDLAREQLWLAAPRVEPGRDAAKLPYSFRHALFRQVLYERTAPSARAQFHGKVGAALERERAAGGPPVVAAELAMHFERGREPMTALRYYAEAAETALACFSPAECMSLTESALSLLGQAPEGTERQALEITLATLQGVSVTHQLGISSPEAKDAFQRAYALLDDVPQHPLRGLLLHGFGFVLCLRAEYAEALAVAERAEALPSATDDPVLLLAACTVQGEVQMLRGRPRIAREWIEQGLAAKESLAAPAEQSFVADPRVTLLGLLAIQLLHLGWVETARARLREAHARARQLGQPMARMVAIWFDAMFEVRLGNAERVAALADEMRALVDEFALAQGRTASRWFRGWANARMGEPREGYRWIREGYEENTRLGMLAGASETLGYAAEALMLAGDWDAAQHQLEEALQIANAYGERVYLPQLFLIEAAIARARGESAVAEAAVRRAVAEARAQEAPWLELMALLELCERDGATTEDRQALAALADRLPEAVGTTAFTKARAPLDQTKPA
jgi:DNA-binding winged helix-turn-helix (wHTH) protein/tetratricopeptide (TPR) repeat protein